MQIRYRDIKKCCQSVKYDGSIVPIPQDEDSKYGNCYKCCCIENHLLNKNSKIFNLQNDYMYNVYYLYDKSYKQAFEKCNGKLHGDLNGKYFHQLRVCTANELRWNVALDITKTYYFINQITKMALKKVISCKPFKFDEVYIDQAVEFYGDKSNDIKECLGFIYKYATVALRGISNFTIEYGHHADIFFYYKSSTYRDNYRKCLLKYINKAMKNSRDIYDLLQCSHKRSPTDDLLVR